MTAKVEENVLGADPRPRFFPFQTSEQLGLAPPEPRRDRALRTYVRSLAGMQKEALIVASGQRRGWRLVSDEGPYLAGHDEAPFPLAFLTAGMAASYATELVALAERQGRLLDGLRLTLDNRYTMEGSALRGTMVGGARNPELRVELAAPFDRACLLNLAADAVSASPLNGLLRGEHRSLFTLTHNGRPLAPSRVQPLPRPAEPDADDRYEDVSVDGPGEAERLVNRIATAASHRGEGGAGSSLQPDQRRTLHVRGTCTLRADGVKVIDVRLLQPTGSSFRFLSDEPADAGGRGRAPDAATLTSAGIAFCFMTQFGRYAAITKRRLERYRIIQDTHCSVGGASGGTGRAGAMDPVETHVYLDSAEDDDFARTLLDMGEQTCFLHALCRTGLTTKMTLTAPIPTG